RLQKLVGKARKGFFDSLRQGCALPAPPWGKLSFCLAYGKAGRRIQKRNAVIDKDRNVMCTINKTNMENIYKNTY
uniref:hypothetical protein n=1 Tax=Faecousia sp. TaxID=2952921 RepID=UPI0040259221